MAKHDENDYNFDVNSTGYVLEQERLKGNNRTSSSQGNMNLQNVVSDSYQQGIHTKCYSSQNK